MPDQLSHIETNVLPKENDKADFWVQVRSLSSNKIHLAPPFATVDTNGPARNTNLHETAPSEELF